MHRKSTRTRLSKSSRARCHRLLAPEVITPLVGDCDPLLGAAKGYLVRWGWCLGGSREGFWCGLSDQEERGQGCQDWIFIGLLSRVGKQYSDMLSNCRAKHVYTIRSLALRSCLWPAKSSNVTNFHRAVMDGMASRLAFCDNNSGSESNAALKAWILETRRCATVSGWTFTVDKII